MNKLNELRGRRFEHVDKLFEDKEGLNTLIADAINALEIIYLVANSEEEEELTVNEKSVFIPITPEK